MLALFLLSGLSRWDARPTESLVALRISFYIPSIIHSRQGNEASRIDQLAYCDVYLAPKVRLLLEWGAEVMVIDNKGKLPLHLVGQSASQKNRGKSDEIIKLLKSKMPEDDDEGGSYFCLQASACCIARYKPFSGAIIVATLVRFFFCAATARLKHI